MFISATGKKLGIIINIQTPKDDLMADHLCLFRVKATEYFTEDDLNEISEDTFCCTLLL